MSTETVEKGSDEVDVESFVETDEEVDLRSSTGFARLKSCRIVENPSTGLPEDYVDEFSGFTYDRYFVFDAEKVSGGSDNVSVVLPVQEDHKEIEVAYDWTDSRSISDLAGCVVPLRHVNGSSYRVAEFDGLLSGMLSVDTASSLVDRGIFEYSHGDWGLHYGIVLTLSVSTCLVFTGVCLYAMMQGSPLFMIGAGFFLLLAVSIVYSSVKKR